MPWQIYVCFMLISIATWTVARNIMFRTFCKTELLKYKIYKEEFPKDKYDFEDTFEPRVDALIHQNNVYGPTLLGIVVINLLMLAAVVVTLTQGNVLTQGFNVIAGTANAFAILHLINMRKFHRRLTSFSDDYNEKMLVKYKNKQEKENINDKQ